MPSKNRKRKTQKGDGFKDFYNGIKSGYQAVSSLGSLSNQYNKIMADNSKIGPPLPPKPEALRAPRIAQTSEPMSFHQTLKKYKPLGSIDNVLRDLGYRDAVRSKLSSSKVGQFLVNATDLGIKNGYGNKKRRRIQRGGNILLYGSKSLKF